MPLSPYELAAVLIAVAAGAAIQASVGFGLALTATPILLLIEPRLVPGPMLGAVLVLTLLTLQRDREGVDAANLGPALVGGALGAIAGAVVLAVLPDRLLGVAFGSVILVAVGMSLAGHRLQPTRWALVGAGAASGLMGTISSMGGPALALLYQDARGVRLRGTLAGFLALSTVLSLGALGVIGRFGGRELVLTLVLVPGVAVGFALSPRVMRILDGGYTRVGVLVLSTVAAVIAILRELL